MMNIRHAYYEWLCGFVNHEGIHNLLLKDLYNKRFRWFIPNDDNRAFEGKNLRERFCEEEDIDILDVYFDDDIVMLELILALTFRCDSIMEDNIDNLTISEWFWMLLANCGLAKFTDEEYDDLGGRLETSKILDTLIDRKYKCSGKGGLFPLRKSSKDQRKVELWYQMNEYLMENYYTNE